MSDARLRLLQEMPVFGGIREDTLSFLLGLAPVVAVPKCSHFFREGETGTSMYVLEQGRVAILKAWEGRIFLLRHFAAGDCFGEVALMDFCPRGASAFALDDCRAIEVSCATLYALYEKDLEQFVMIQMNLGREVCRRLRMADADLFRTRIEANTVDGRLIFATAEAD